MIRIMADTRNAKQHWERRSDELPYLMVPMSDGRVVRYYPQVEQPAFTRAIQNIRNMVVGYEKPADATNIQPAAQKRIQYSIPHNRRDRNG